MSGTPAWKQLRMCSAHSRQTVLWHHKTNRQFSFHSTLSTAANPLTTLNRVIVCLGCWCVLLLSSIYFNLTDVSWKALCQALNMLRYQCMFRRLNEFLKAMHNKLTFFCLFAVSGVVFTLFSDHSSVASWFKSDTELNLKSVQLCIRCSFTLCNCVCVCMGFILKTCYQIKTGILFTL